jgi:Uma2 family endonuclease
MTLAIDEPPPPRAMRWTKRDYNDLTERGFFDGKRVYLFRGELIEMSPQYHPHAFALTELSEELHDIFRRRQGFKVRVQMPFDAPGESMPEPDALVCTVEQYKRIPHPNRAELVIEVADSSILADREKAFEYAAAQIPEYWIINVRARCVEVYRHPVVDTAVDLGFRYPPATIVTETQSIAPLVKPQVEVAVGQFFYKP